MIVDDPVLPAAAHLTGPGAHAVLATAVSATGCELVSCRPSHVQYRPGADLVVRYRATVRTLGTTVSDTLLAATTPSGAPAGTLPVEAETSDGSAMQVGVWRWPFDPMLKTLDQVVTPHLARGLLGDRVGRQPNLDVIAFRPTERAVVRVDPGDGRAALYVKVVAPSETAGLLMRHDRLAAAGLPVPHVVASGSGWIAMEAISGPTLRDLLKSGRPPWPPTSEYESVLGGLAGIDRTGLEPARSRIEDGPAHAAMLASVLPAERLRLERIAELLTTTAAMHQGPRSVVHGDLHEAQLVVDGTRVVGLLDIDDVGLGDPLDDVANLLAHLMFRGSTAEGDGHLVSEYAGRLRRGLAADRDPHRVDRALAAILVGLATGPFRIQQPGWQRTTADQLDRIEGLLAGTPLATLG